MANKALLDSASEQIGRAKQKFFDAEKTAREVLANVLKPAGENGVSISPLDFIGGFYVATAEIEPQKFEPILHVRFWNGKLEAFIPNYEVCEDGPGWKILDGGKWVDYKETCADTWFLLDEVMYNLEYADGYQD